jgi:hypothetical protein
MQRTSSRLAFVFAVALGLGAAAQGPYLVDGQLGVDAPGNGVAGMPPWRTIGYALAHVVPPPAGAASVFVQGGQIYAAATNGEAFPIDVPPYVAVEGITSAGAPVLQPQAGAAALRLAAATSYANAPALLRWLVVQGGDVGLQCGAAAGSAHRPLVEDCEFIAQATAGVQVNGDAGTDEPLLRRCHLAGVAASGRGVQPLLLASHTTQTIVLEQCHLDHLGAGVASDNHGFAIDHCVQNLRADSCQFEACATAFDLQMPTAFSGPALDSSCVVENTRIANCAIGVFASTGGGTITAQRSIALRDSVVDGSTTGVRLASGGTTASGAVSLTIERSTLAHCTKAIDLWDPSSGFAHVIVLRDSHFLFDGTALVCLTSRFSTGNVSMERCRFLDGVHGVDAHFDGFFSTTVIASCVFARLAGTAIRYDGAPTSPVANHLAIHHATIADCNSGIEIVACDSQSGGDHLVLGGNGTDLSLSPPPFAVFPIAYSISDTTTLPGPTNLPMQDPLLVRPQYKLAMASPCRDAGVVTSATPALDYEGDARVIAAGPGLPALPDLGADEYATGGSLRVYGTGGCGPSGVKPRIGSTSSAAPIGGAYEVDLAGAAIAGSPAPSFAFLMTGFQDVPPAPLLDLAAIGMPGSYLWLDPTLIDGPFAVSASGATTVARPAPSLAMFAGLALQHQWLVVLSSPYGFVTSDALRVTFDL